MGTWRDGTRLVGASLLAAGIVVPLVALGPGAGAAVGPIATSTAIVAYSCAGAGFAAGFGTLPTQNVTVTMTAPAEVTVGEQFPVTVALSPLALAYPGFDIQAGVYLPLSPVGATGGVNADGAARSGAVTIVGNTFNVPIATMNATATAAAGGSASFTANNFSILVGSTGFVCSKVAASPAATISTQIVGALTTTTAPTTTTATTIPGQTTTTVDPSLPTTTSTTTTSTTTTTTTSTTVAPTSSTAPATIVTTTAPPVTAPPTPAGTVANIITPSSTGSFTCNIYDSDGTKFNQNPLPSSTVTVTITIPDKVGTGGTISGLVKMDPGPLNGPIALKAGSATFAIDLTVAGSDTTVLNLTGGPNGSQIAPNTAAVSPSMPFSVKATAAAGSEVAFGVKQVEVRASSPSVLITRCVPSGAAMAKVAAVSVLAANAVVESAELTKTISSAAKATAANAAKSTPTGDGGYANCAAAKAAGRGTILKSDSAYRARLDADGDGLACESDDPAVLGASLARTGGSTMPLVAGSLACMVVGASLLGAAGRRRARSLAGA